MTRPQWAERVQSDISKVLEKADPMISRGDLEGRPPRSPSFVTVDACLRWAIWCVESLYELIDLVDHDDARGENLTPLGHRATSVAMGHVMWACVSAMGAFDRTAAAFAALHLPPRDDDRLFDFAGLYQRRRQVKDCEPVRQWLRDVKTDRVYADILSLLRDPMIHQTTAIAYYASVGTAPPWEGRPPHHDAPGFYIGEGYERSISIVKLLEEATPSAERHVRHAIEIVTDGSALPSSAG